MKFKLFLLLVFSLIYISANSVNNYIHYFGTYSTASYAGLMSYKSSLPSAHGGGGTVGFVYEFHPLYGYMFFTGFNMEFNILQNSIENKAINLYNTDTQNTNYYLSLYFTDRKDVLRETNLQIPLLWGAYNEKYYFLAGVKLSLNVASSSILKATATAIGTYDRYFDPFHDMPNHGLVSYQDIYDIKDGIGYYGDVLLSVEGGYNFVGEYNATVFTPDNRIKKTTRAQYVVRFALFADYGLINNYIGKKSELYEIYDPDPLSLDAIVMNHSYNVKQETATYANNINVGVKFTYLFSIYCHRCQTIRLKNKQVGRYYYNRYRR